MFDVFLHKKIFANLNKCTICVDMSSFCFFWLAQMAYWLTNRRWNQTNLGQVQPLVKVDDEQKNDLARVVSLQRSTRVISHNIILNSQEENMKILI